MITDAPYIVRVAARLLLAGAWDDALALLEGQAGPDAAELRARILVERNWWRLDDPAAAAEAVAALPEGSVGAALLGAQLAYTRLLFGLEPGGDDERDAEAGFRVAAEDPATGGWGGFWLGVLRQNIHEDDAEACPLFEEALRRARAEGDLLLESYAVRHLAGYAPEGEQESGYRRSLQLRAALGARPQVAAAQLTLADELPEGPERALLLEAARATAEELGLTWVLKHL